MKNRLWAYATPLAFLAACTSSVPLGGAYSDYSEYLSTDVHYKAFATTRVRNHGQAWGWALGERTPQAAIDEAMNGCNAGRSPDTSSSGCILHSIGNREVSGLSETELEEAIRQYKTDPGSFR